MVQYFDLSGSSDWQLDPPCSIIHNCEMGVPNTILELGSGTGYVGLKLPEKLPLRGKSDDLLILSDLVDVCPLLEENLRLRRQESAMPMQISDMDIKIAPLPWGETDECRKTLHFLNSYQSSKASGSPEKVQRHLTHIICSDLVSLHFHSTRSCIDSVR